MGCYEKTSKKEKMYDYTMKIYKDVFKPIIEDEYGMYDLLITKKLLVGFYQYCKEIGLNDPKDIIDAIKIDYGVE